MIKRALLVGMLLMTFTFINTYSNNKKIPYNKGYITYYSDGEKVYIPNNLRLRVATIGNVAQYDCISAKGEYQWVSDGILLKGMWCNVANIKTTYKHEQYLKWTKLQYDNIPLFIPDHKIIGNIERDNTDQYILFDLELTE